VREVAVALLTIVGTGCDTAIHYAGEATADAPVSGKCQQAALHSDFVWIRDNIFAVSCSAFSSCHQGTRAAGMLNLTTAKAYDQLVNVAALEPGWVRVVPGDPDHSYLLVKISGAPGPLGDGGVMPPNSAPLCEPKIDAIRRWIAAGAQSGTGGQDAGIVDAASISDGASVD
jgi:hypothetical protein